MSAAGLTASPDCDVTVGGSTVCGRYSEVALAAVAVAGRWRLSELEGRGCPSVFRGELCADFLDASEDMESEGLEHYCGDSIKFTRDMELMTSIHSVA